jgi:hypothetical protein
MRTVSLGAKQEANQGTPSHLQLEDMMQELEAEDSLSLIKRHRHLLSLQSPNQLSLPSCVPIKKLYTTGCKAGKAQPVAVHSGYIT